MRVFAALPLPRAAVDSIAGVIEPIRRRNPGLRWVSESAYHLTLHFFGEIGDDAVSSLARLFDGPSLQGRPIATRLGPLGQFPPTGTPRVLWIALADPEGRLRAYWESFEAAVAPLGWESDRRGFTPHITLARNNGTRVDRDWTGQARTADLEFSLSECVLFQSLLGRSGAQYVPLRRISFGGGAP